MDAGLPESCEPRLGGEGDSTATKAVSLMDSVLPSKQKRNTEGLHSSHSPTVTTADPPKGPEDDDDDVVLVEASAPTLEARTPTNAPSPKLTDCTKKSAMATASMPTQTSKTPPAPALAPATETKSQSETIVIDDEEDSSEQTNSVSLSTAGGAVPASSDSTALSSTEPDSEIKIASVTTLGVAAAEAPRAVAMTAAAPAGPQGDMNLMITSVTSLQSGGSAGAGPGSEQASSLCISNAFSLNPESQGSHTEPSPSKPATFNPGRASTAREPGQNGETATHQKPDSWISQSASFPRNQKQPGVDSPAPAASLPKPVASPSGTQQPSRSVKVTCANCKKPLKKGQTAYQRKGSTHLFCSTTCLSAFSHKPAPKKNCAMCKKNITGMKGAIVAQVDSSESFQEFCSTGCLASYENKQSEPKSPMKTKCSVCGKLTEIRHEVSFKNVTHKICSDLCFNRYRMANGLIMNCCEQCGGYLSSRASANHFLVVDGQQKRFCSQNCVKDYKQTHGKTTSCSGCNSSFSSFDAIHCIGPSGTMEPYCSTACIGKSKSSSTSITTEPTCHSCKRRALPQYQAALPDGAAYNFCSSSCVAKFQSANVQTLNGQTTHSSTSGSIQLKCCYCKAAFSLKPQTLEWENKVYQFCSATCCEDYKKLHCIVTFCEYCQEEKILHETAKFSGVKKPFCSEGCKLLFKQDFARRLGLKCVTCNHCHQMCKKAVTKKVDGVQRDFCSETCTKRFNDWYYKSARCDCCKLQGNLTESVQWRGEMKHFCDQQCLLRFYCQQNEPNLSTQKGPENTAFGYGGQSPETKAMVYSQMAASRHADGGILKDVKNKAVLCKPLAVSKATYCKPHMKSKHCQTEEVVKKEYVPVPVPTPVYIPVPMNMYAQATPTPVILPVPVPVPVFLPTTLDSAEEILQTIAELKAKVPCSTPEADLLAEEEKPNCTDVKCESVEDTARRRGRVKRENSSSSEEEEEEEEEDDSYQPELDLEDDFPSVPNPVPTVEGLDADIGFTLPLVLGEEKEEKPQLAVKRKGRKRKAVERDTLPPSPDTPSDSRSFPLKSRYGVNAWKRWVLTRIDNPNDVTVKHQLKEVKPVRLKRNLLSLSAAELNDGLSRFVREVRRPNGESYGPDSIFYLCLGIQQHLLDNGRTDDIFSDPSYQLFGEELNKVLNGWQPSVLPDGSLWGRVEEQALWSSQQLGQHSPIALLRSLLYLNTKYFGLRTVEQHLRLSFGKVYGHRKISPHSKATSICIRIPTISQEQRVKTGTRKRKHKADYGDPDNEPDNDSGNFSHCPIRKHECLLYELYLSKCPTALKNRTDMFYMTPEVTSSLDSPLWYSSAPLERTVLETLLTRILLIKDIYNQRDLSEEDDEEENDVSQ
ncbi:zinc finger MYM-type protein 2 [Megalops cyprinoides]|uniref:zinc finger MYM-type protein 2 n=1 Tax=Megalops cyprinoides TaxID=118141 RepID=UPI00186518D6|nr:zinc finger MYM-type protein 2 [Megalops cyprinoides]